MTLVGHTGTQRRGIRWPDPFVGSPRTSSRFQFAAGLASQADRGGPGQLMLRACPRGRCAELAHPTHEHRVRARCGDRLSNAPRLYASGRLPFEPHGHKPPEGRVLFLSQGTARQSFHDSHGGIACVFPAHTRSSNSAVRRALAGPALRLKRPSNRPLSPTTVTERLSQMQEKRGSVVSSAVMEMSRLVRLVASPAVPGEKVPHAIARAAHRLGITRGRVKSFWYGTAKPGPEELERARGEAVRRARDVELLRNEYRRARDILARLETRLTTIDAEFHGPQIAALQHMAGGAAGPGGLAPAELNDAPSDGEGE